MPPQLAHYRQIAFPDEATLEMCIGLKSSIEIQIDHSVRSAINGSTLAARLAGTALAASATPATPITASR